MKILLIEDHKALAEITIDMLREMYDHDVEHALNAVQACEMARQRPYDLILIDLKLPDSNGYDLALELRKNSALDRTIFVALTGIGNVVDEARAHASGIDACFVKPMDFGLLNSLRRAQFPPSIVTD
jgi:DNA-binding response OmpR family regulator